MSSAVHGLGRKVTTGEPERDHDGVEGRSRIFDPSVDPPVLGVCLLNNVMAGLVGLDGNDLLHEIGDTLGAAADLFAGVVELFETAAARNDLEGLLTLYFLIVQHIFI